jgi:hypothetical protein
MDNKPNHLQMVQAVITRMGGNSFLLKGWSVTLVSALFALAADKSNHTFALIGYLPVLMFWTLDGYFLRQERLFRALYDKVREQDAAKIDFSMNTAPFVGQVSGVLRVCLSRTLLVFHGALLMTVFLVSSLLAFH